MQQQRRTALAIASGAVAAVLWQVTGEIVARMIGTGSVPPAWLPSGTSFPLSTVLGLVPNGGLWLLGALLSFLLMGGLVVLGLRLVLRSGFDGARSFLAIWMVVVLAAVLASALTQPILNSYGAAASVAGPVFGGAYWGVTVGWVIAAVVALGSRRTRS